MPDDRFVIISHFWNEEVLLPLWLQHHVALFDHGVLINYASTDRSCDIIRSIAPHWEIRASKNEMFGARACDAEVMAVEEEFECWKMVLNTTEFLLVDDLRSYVDGVIERSIE